MFSPLMLGFWTAVATVAVALRLCIMLNYLSELYTSEAIYIMFADVNWSPTLMHFSYTCWFLSPSSMALLRHLSYAVPKLHAAMTSLHISMCSGRPMSPCTSCLKVVAATISLLLGLQWPSRVFNKHFVLAKSSPVRPTTLMCSWPIPPDQAFMQVQMNSWGSFFSVMPFISISTLFLQALKQLYIWLPSVQSRLGPFVCRDT